VRELAVELVLHRLPTGYSSARSWRERRCHHPWGPGDTEVVVIPLSLFPRLAIGSVFVKGALAGAIEYAEYEPQRIVLSRATLRYVRTIEVLPGEWRHLRREWRGLWLAVRKGDDAAHIRRRSPAST